MGRSFRLLLAAAIFHLPTPAADDTEVTEAAYRLAREASKFWQTAPGFLARETARQRVLIVRRKRSGALDPAHPPGFQSRELVSWYALSAFRGAPEAMREFRWTFEVDGKPVASESAARADFIADLTRGGDELRQRLLDQFEKQTLPGAASDFGQVLLLFTKGNLHKYAFSLTGESRVGADPAQVWSFRQTAGTESLRIVDGTRKLARKLEGEVLVRQGDFLPLRVNLNSLRREGKSLVRDEASVDYAVSQGALLPASLTYRRYLDDALTVETTYRYDNWQPLR